MARGTRAPKWRDQHLKTCACKQCAPVPFQVPEIPLSVTPLGSEYSDALVYDGDNPLVPKFDIPEPPKPAPPPEPEPLWADLSEYFAKWEFKVSDWNTFKLSEVVYSNHVQPSKVYWLPATTWSDVTITYDTSSLVSTWPTYDPPTVELLESSNPFSRVLDAWQTGKAGWTKGTVFRRQPQPEGAST